MNSFLEGILLRDITESARDSITEVWFGTKVVMFLLILDACTFGSTTGYTSINSLATCESDKVGAPVVINLEECSLKKNLDGEETA
mmetsp:Transcript_15955/g.35926  ORF Transcript_15955/g.35926 Transcript_15955/m.35926 type:complete len:86 (+) Transcript_15955:231-488(+)